MIGKYSIKDDGSKTVEHEGGYAWAGAPVAGCSGEMLFGFPFDPPPGDDWKKYPESSTYKEYLKTPEEIAKEILAKENKAKTGHLAMIALRYQSRIAKALEIAGYKRVFEFDSSHVNMGNIPEYKGQRVALYAKGQNEVVTPLGVGAVAPVPPKKGSKGIVRRVKTLGARFRSRKAVKVVR